MYTSEKIKLGLIAISIFGVFFLSYMSMVQIPREQAQSVVDAEKLRIDEARRIELERRMNIDICMAIAYQNYSTDWDNQCITLGKEVDCTLSAAYSTDFNDRLAAEKNRCINIYQ